VFALRGSRALIAVRLSVFVSGPDGIEVSRRAGKDASVFVLINFKRKSQDVKLPRGIKSLLEKKEVTHVVLPQYSVAARSWSLGSGLRSFWT
jgi:beta-galactosidase GanA